jgi:hypothetical protein
VALAGSHRTLIDAAIIRRPLIDGQTDAIAEFGGGTQRSISNLL